MFKFLKSQQLSQCTLLLCLCLLLALYAQMTLFYPVAGKQPNLIIFMLHAIPIGGCILLALKKGYKSFIWINFISLLFFCVATANIFSGYGWVVYAEIGLTTAVFVSSLLAAMKNKKSSMEFED